MLQNCRNVRCVASSPAKGKSSRAWLSHHWTLLDVHGVKLDSFFLWTRTNTELKQTCYLSALYVRFLFHNSCHVMAGFKVWILETFFQINFDQRDDIHNNNLDWNNENIPGVEVYIHLFYYRQQMEISGQFNPLNAELNPICHLLALLDHHIFHGRGLKVNVTFRRIPTIWGPGCSWCSSNRISFPPRTHFLGHSFCSFVTASTELPHAHRLPCYVVTSGLSHTTWRLACRISGCCGKGKSRGWDNPRNNNRVNLLINIDDKQWG